MCTFIWTTLLHTALLHMKPLDLVSLWCSFEIITYIHVHVCENFTIAILFVRLYSLKILSIFIVCGYLILCKVFLEQGSLKPAFWKECYYETNMLTNYLLKSTGYMLLTLCFLNIFPGVRTSHFRGGLLTWTAVNNYQVSKRILTCLNRKWQNYRYTIKPWWPRTGTLRFRKMT